MRKTRNVFISHAHSDDEELPRLKALLKTRGYTMRDFSIDSSKPNNANNADYIKSGILRPRIDAASALIVLISPATHTREWVNWEIEYAGKTGKPVIGVYVRGGTESDLPAAFHDWGHALTGWNSEKIIDAVEGHTRNWRSPDGALIPTRTISRHCQ